MRYKENWEETQEHFKAWWNHSKIGRPLMKVVARRKTPLELLEHLEPHTGPEEMY